LRSIMRGEIDRRIFFCWALSFFRSIFDQLMIGGFPCL